MERFSQACLSQEHNIHAQRRIQNNRPTTESPQLLTNEVLFGSSYWKKQLLFLLLFVNL